MLQLTISFNLAKMILQKMSTMMYCDIASVHDGKRKVSNMNFVTSNLHIFVHSTEKPFQCDICNIDLFRKKNFK